MSKRRKDENGEPIVVRNHTKLDKELVDTLCGYIARGVPVTTARDFLCFSDTAFYSWLRKGENYLNGNQENADDKIYGYFVQQLKYSLAKYEITMIGKVHQGGKSWTAYMTMLERRNKSIFGRNSMDIGSDENFDSDETFI